MSAFLRKRFGCKVRKVALHAGLTCPNRDGTLGRGGCAYCANQSFSPEALRGVRPVREQMLDGMSRLGRRFGAGRFIAYFQSFTNTYAPVARLRELYDSATDLPDVVGLSIGTRPDCVPDETLDLVQSYAERLDVWLEYGVQSARDETLRRMSRGHDFAAFVDAAARTRGRGMSICAHVILGLPGETREDMMATAEKVNAVGVDGIKLHHLYVARGAALAADYDEGGVRTLAADEYVALACDFLERLSADTVVHRLVGETTTPDMLLAPVWPLRKGQVIEAIAEEFRRRGTWQGARC